MCIRDRMKFVHPFADKEANMVLIEAVRGGGALMTVEKPIKMCIRDRRELPKAGPITGVKS